MASKKRYVFLKKFQQGKKFGCGRRKISAAAFEIEGHFCRHSERTIILSFANKGHKKGDTHSLKGTIRGIYTSYF